MSDLINLYRKIICTYDERNPKWGTWISFNLREITYVLFMFTYILHTSNNICIINKC